jgi:hypothetical protein
VNLRYSGRPPFLRCPMKLSSILFPSLMTIGSLGLMPMQAIAFSVTTPVITPEQTLESQLQRRLFGDSSRLTNISLDLGAITAAYGLFDQDDFLGLGQGLVMSTGQVSSLAGVNCADGVNPALDVDRNPSCTGRLQAPATDLNFDFTNKNPGSNVLANPPDDIWLKVKFNAAQAGQLSFKYVFGSEEYPEFKPSKPGDPPTPGNDLFLFGMVNQQQSAWIGGSSVEKATFNSNLIGQPNSLKTPLDGYTDPLTAVLRFTEGDNTLHLRLKDVGGEGFDSAVFLQQISVQIDPVQSVPTPPLIFGFAWMGFLRWRDRDKRR